MNRDISLIEKLDEFIRKYYRNRVIRGILLSFALLGLGRSPLR